MKKKNVFCALAISIERRDSGAIRVGNRLCPEAVYVRNANEEIKRRLKGRTRLLNLKFFFFCQNFL